MKQTLLRSLAVSALVLAAHCASAAPDPSADQDVDWSSITGSVPANNAPFFRLIPPEQSLPQSEGGDVLQRLPIDAGQLRFEGETGHRDIPVYVRKDQAGLAATLKLRFRNSVAVMPEASRLKVSINDRVVAEVLLDSSGEPSTANVPVPAGLLEAGYNAVTFEISQRHRVDCTIEAASELWTEIDPAGTGLQLVRGQDLVASFEELVAMPVGEDSAVPITVILPQGADNAMIDQAIRAAQSLALRVGWQKPRIAFARETSTNPGVHIHVGTAPAGEGMFPAQDAALAVSGRLNGIVRVAIAGANAEAIGQNVFRMLAEKPEVTDIGTAAGLRARQRQKGVPIEPGTEIALHQAGLTSQSFNGRVYRASLDIRLPPDFYPADNGKATMFVDGEYVAGLAGNNEALVRINGKVAGAARLSRSGGDTLNRRAVEVTLKAFQPGINTVTLEVRTATESDRDCNPLDQIDTSPRLTVKDTTSFAVPPVSRIRHLPSLSATAAAGFPFGQGETPVGIYMPKPDLPALGAAATLLTRTAISAGKPILSQMLARRPDADNGSALIVAPFSEVPTVLLDHFGIKRDMVPKTWSARRAPKRDEAPQASLGMLTRLAAVFGPGSTGFDDESALTTASLPEAPVPAAPKVRWGQQVEEVSTSDRMRQGLSQFLQRNIGYTPDQLSFLDGDRSAITAPKHAGLMLAQQQAMAGGHNTWLLLTGPDSDTIARETTGLISGTTWNRLNGRMVAFDPGERALTAWPEGQHYYYQMQDWSVSNVTLVAAGWLSNHIQYYILVILIACGAFGFVTRKLLNRIGAQP